MDILFLIGRVLFGGFFAFSGLHHFTDRGMMTQYAAAKKVPAPALAVMGSGALVLAGGLSVLLGAWSEVGLWLIIFFLLGVTFPMHNFWASSNPQERQIQMIMFMKNMALLGAALMMLELTQLWPYALNFGK